MNAYDATRMVDILQGQGFVESKHIDEAELVILNTCHIRELASEKAYSELGRINEIKLARSSQGLDTVIAVAGCVAQAEGAEIIKRQKAVDLVIGPQSYHRLPELIRLARSQPGIVVTEFESDDKFAALTPPSIEQAKRRGVTAFVTIQEGCDKFCTFCVVPYTRGVETSRPVEHILTEIERLAEAGIREVTLLGQNVNAYHGRDSRGKVVSLPRLVGRISEIRGICRIRYTTSHPKDMTDELVEAHRDIPALMPFIHLPVQSGSDRILKAMNRGHCVRDYLGVIDRLRKFRSDIALSSDFIVGFPGETKSDFEATLDLVRNVKFSNAFSFKYSGRPGTPASQAADQIAEVEKRERLAQLQLLLEAQRDTFNRSADGAVLDVLFDRIGRFPGQIAGKSPFMHAVHVEAPQHMVGAVTSVRIVQTASTSLRGQLIGESLS